MNTKLVGLSLLAAVAAVPTVQAQGLGDRFEIGAFGQYTKIDEKIKMDDVLGVGGMVAMSVYKWFGVEADVQVGRTKATRSPFEDITYRPARVLGTFTLPVTPSKKASLVLGGGYVNSIYDGRASANEYEEGFAALVGLKLCSSGKWGGRLDGLMNTNPSPNEQELTGTSRNFGVRLGATYALRGTCAAAGQKFDWALKIDPASATVNKGATRQFALSAADMKATPIILSKVQNLVCTSSDPSVATVDNTGLVTAVKAGTTTISCKGLVKKLERTASSTVTVPPPAWTLALTPSSGSTDVGKTLSFTSKAVDADNVDLGAVTWSSANTSIASVSNGTVTCNAAGTTTITVTKESYGSTKTASSSVECKALPAARVALDQALFNFDKSIVLKAGMDSLRVVIEAMRRVPSLRISIEGHTDWYGDESYNNTLAKSRADAVTKQLLKLAGKDAASFKDRIMTSSFGEQCVIVRDGDPDPNPPRPRVSSDNKSKQAPNRRVEIWQLLDGGNAPTGCRSESERAGRLSFGDIR